MTAYRILSGLPPYGPPAISFPDPKAFREGLVVEFVPDSSSPWIGNFQQFSAHLPNTVHIELGSSAVVVVAGGAGYVIDCEQRRLIRDLGIDRTFLVPTGFWRGDHCGWCVFRSI